MNFGSNVSADSTLLSPLLYYLSAKYDYIIFDVDGSDPGLESEAIAVSDYIVPVSVNGKEIRKVNSGLSGMMNDGQILVNAIRGFHDYSESSAKLLIPEFQFGKDDSIKDVVFRTAEEDTHSIEMLCKKRDYIAFPAGGLDALFYAGLLPLIGESLKEGSIIKCHSFAYPLIALY
ncbi:MAG TPA: hypothetical protein PKK43_11660, partial [Spirochaetota bacterium]|nr:hypothetical protein [Spirochaetota bacterium]